MEGQTKINTCRMSEQNKLKIKSIQTLYNLNCILFIFAFGKYTYNTQEVR